MFPRSLNIKMKRRHETVNLQHPTLLLEGLRHGVVSRLLLQGFAPWSCSSLSSENIWNPGVLVCELPEGDSNTFLNVHARLNDRGIVVGLLLEILSGLRECQTDIQLSYGDFNIEVIGPGAPNLLHRV